MDLTALLETTLTGLGYELVDVERSGRGMLRVFIDKPAVTGGDKSAEVDGSTAGGINVDDCALVSHHLSRVLTVENVDYDRLEISSPGLDRPLKKERDFVRFAGQKAKLRLRVPLDGQRSFLGVLKQAGEGRLQIEVEGVLKTIELSNLDKARLVPEI